MRLLFLGGLYSCISSLITFSFVFSPAFLLNTNMRKFKKKNHKKRYFLSIVDYLNRVCFIGHINAMYSEICSLPIWAILLWGAVGSCCNGPKDQIQSIWSRPLAFPTWELNQDLQVARRHSQPQRHHALVSCVSVNQMAKEQKVFSCCS